jgi:hypothetical protein
LTHTEFVAAYRAARITVTFDPVLAGKFVSARLLLPLMMLPLLGAGVGLALMGWLWTGLLTIATGMIVPRLIKRSAPHFLLTQMLDDATLYVDALRAGIMRLDTVNPQHSQKADIS